MSPILALLLFAADPASARYDACAALAKADPTKAEAEAIRWRDAGGGLPARQCLGLAYAAQERWQPAALAFEQAATEAEKARDGRAATFWVQAANAALAGDDAAQARRQIDRALALPVMGDVLRGEAYLDRARAGVALADLPAARADLDQALALAPADPLAWLLSATLARRQKDLARAQADIARAVKLSADDASVQVEAGNIAALSGNIEAARSAWTKAATIAPQSPAGIAAKDGLAQLAQ